jgi:Helix-turn-helix domain
VEVMGRVKTGSLRLQEAAELLELSYRQGKRVWARYRGGGAKALQHRNCGRRSEPGIPDRVPSSGAGSGAGALCRFRTDAGE